MLVQSAACGSSCAPCTTGNRKGLPKYVAVNLGDLNDFPESQTVSLESVKAANLIKCNVKDSKLPLKVLIL